MAIFRKEKAVTIRLSFPLKKSFYSDLNLFTQKQKFDHFIIMGDFNISHQDIDIGIGENKCQTLAENGYQCSFLPEEREWLNHLIQLGYC